MKLPDQAVREFQEIFLRVHGEELTEDEAREEAQNFMNLCLFLSEK